MFASLFNPCAAVVLYLYGILMLSATMISVKVHSERAFCGTQENCETKKLMFENLPVGSGQPDNVITSHEADCRGREYDRQGRMCLFDLDYNESESNPFVVDAGRCSNLAYFVNHSCDPNMAVYPVWVDNLDPNLPRLALFATRDVGRHEELTCDYWVNRRIDDGKRQMKNEPKATGALTPCRCGAHECRKWL